MEDLNIWILIAQIINFWIIFFIFYYFLWSKIVKIIEDRREQLKQLENSWDVVKQKISEAEKKAEELIAEARNKASEIQRNAEELSKRQTQEELKKAEEKANSIVESALRDIEKERLTMVTSLKDKILDYSLKVNAKLFWESQSHKDFVKKEVNSIKI